MAGFGDAIGTTAVNSMTGTLGAFTHAFRSADAGIAVAGGLVGFTFLAWQMNAAIAKKTAGSPAQMVLIEFAGCLAYAIIVWHMASIIGWFSNALCAFGSKGSALKGNAMANPSLIMSAGYALLANHWKQFKDLDWMDMISHSPVLVLIILSQFGFLASAVAVIKTVVMANAQIMVGAVMTPFLVISHPMGRNIGWYGVTMIVSASVEMAVKSVLIGIGYAVLSSIKLKADADIQDIVTMCGQVWAVTMICSDFGGIGGMIRASKGG